MPETWLDQLICGGFRISKNMDCRASVRCTDTSGDTFGRINGHREIGLVAFAIIGHHGIETESLKMVLYCSDTNEAPSMTDHHVDGFRGGGSNGCVNAGIKLNGSQINVLIKTLAYLQQYRQRDVIRNFPGITDAAEKY